MLDPKRLVQAGYDRIARRFDDFQARVEGSPRMRYAQELVELLPPTPDVLELGCGGGVDSTRLLARQGTLTAVDLSIAQIRLARERVPAASFVHGDFTQIEFDPESFDAVVSFFALTHVRQADLAPLLMNIRRWLRRGGFFLGTFGGDKNHETIQPDWLGTPMFFASLTPDESRKAVQTAGLTILRDQIESMEEPDGYGRVSFLWLLAQKLAQP